MVAALVATAGSGGREEGESNTLPLELALGLNAFDEEQRAIELALRLSTLSALDRTPEERRDMLAAWMESNRSLLEAQVARADDLDLLFAKYGINPTPDELEAVEAQRPNSATEAGSANGRLWAFNRDLAELRQRLEDDPEQLRDALHAWHEVNHQALLAVETELREEIRVGLSVSTQDLSGSEMVSLVPPKDAPAEIHRLFDLQNELTDAMDADPSPLAGGQDADFDEMDAWRERISRTLDPIVSQLDALNHEITEKTFRQLATEARRETTR